MKSLLSVALVCMLGMASALFAANNKSTSTSNGLISAVEKNSLTITSGTTQNLKSFRITKDTKIKLDGHPSETSKLAFGQKVRVVAYESTNPDDKNKAKEAVEIDAHTAVAASPSPSPSSLLPTAKP